MPLRKRKGRGRPTAGRTKKDAVSEAHPTDRDAVEDETQSREETKSDVQAGSSGVTREGDGIDEEERRARETIALLAKKYQVSCTIHSAGPHDALGTNIRVLQVKLTDDDSSNSLHIIQVDESEHNAVSKENRRHPHSPLSSRRPRLLPHKPSKLPKQTKVLHERDTTPVFKVPRPLAHHSTPAGSGQRTLFGFEELDSPLTLSPVATTPSRSHSSLTVSHGTAEEEASKVTKPSPYSRLKGTYDIPFKKKTPKRPPPRRKKV